MDFKYLWGFLNQNPGGYQETIVFGLSVKTALRRQKLID